MKIDAALVAKLAVLSRINVPEDARVPLAAELSKILDWVEQLKEVDVEGIAPMTSASAQNLRWREDEVTTADNSDAILANAPKSAAGFFVVPKVIE